MNLFYMYAVKNKSVVMVVSMKGYPIYENLRTAKNKTVSY